MAAGLAPCCGLTWSCRGSVRVASGWSLDVAAYSYIPVRKITSTYKVVRVNCFPVLRSTSAGDTCTAGVKLELLTCFKIDGQIYSTYTDTTAAHILTRQRDSIASQTSELQSSTHPARCMLCCHRVPEIAVLQCRLSAISHSFRGASRGSE